MSSSIEWLEVENAPVRILKRGDYVDTHPEPIGRPLAIRFGFDNGSVIEGSREELLAMLESARLLIESKDIRGPSNHPRFLNRKHVLTEIVLSTRGKAEEVIDALFDIVSKYEHATVADLYNLVGFAPNYMDEKFGWVDLRGAGVKRVRKGYSLDLPTVEMLSE